MCPGAQDFSQELPITCTVLQGEVCVLALWARSTQATLEARMETQTPEKEKPVGWDALTHLCAQTEHCASSDSSLSDPDPISRLSPGHHQPLAQPLEQLQP